MSGDSQSPQPFALVEAEYKDKAEDQSAIQQLVRWIKQSLHQRNDSTLKEALEGVLEDHVESGLAISQEERTLLRNMLAFGELTVSDVMIPRPDIIAVPDTIDQEAMKTKLDQHMHTRIPVYHESLDNVLGFIHLKDVYRCLSGGVTFDIASMKRDVLFVPRSMKIIDLLVKMRVSGCHMAMVIDEFGGTDGLVTMEDLFEEIVGEIQDEHDDMTDSPTMHWISDRIVEADARIEIDELMHALKIERDDDTDDNDYDTLGGLIFSHLGRVPAKGEIVDYRNLLKLEILTADPRRIKKVRITKHLEEV